jgi:transposase
VTVADPLKNRWIAGDENVADLSAARKLALLLRGGFIHPVHHGLEQHQLFKELVQTYHDTARELARFKNKLKAKFRQHGVHCPGSEVYQPAHREAWREQLEAPLARMQADLLWERIDLLGAQQKALKRELIRQSKAFPIIGRFQALAGIGPIRAATFFAFVDTPHRFAHKRKLWAYCGLSVVRRRSDQMVGPEHLTRRGNRALKNVAKGAALRAISEGDNAFARQYEKMIQRGIKPENARLTVARAIVSAMYAMWRKGEPYQPRG